MDLFNILDCTICAVILIFHIITQVLLHRRKHPFKNKNQIYLLTALFLTETVLALKSIFGASLDLANLDSNWLYDTMAWLNDYLSVCLGVLYHSYTILLTLDRFFIFYFNVRYSVRCKPRTLLKCIYTILAFSLVLALAVIASSSFKREKYQEIQAVLFLVYIGLGTLFIFLAVITYTYIFEKYRRHKKRKLSVTSIKEKDQFKHIIPAIIIANHILFTVFPSFMFLFMKLNFLEANEIITGIMKLMYRFGWLADPLIYVFGTNSLNCKRTKLQTISSQSWNK